MNTEEKAKAYDEAVNKLRRFMEQGIDPLITRADIQDFFPEFQESKNEKIMKGIKSILEHYKECGASVCPYPFVSIDEALTWLEKQCYTKKDVDDAYLKGICYTKHELEKQGEQESADKHEPKFNVGDWITNGDYTWKVIKVEQFDYILQSQDGNIVDDTISYVDKQFHSFTVKDAKDGDVLCTYECGTPKIVFILKGTPKKHYALGYHCYYNIMYPHFGPDSEKGCLAPNDEDVKPATKEQRDTLERAITNAGYTFNFEKKELKKIKQNIAEWSEEDIRNIENIDSVLFYDKDLPEETCMRLRNWLKSLKPNKDMVEALRTEYEKGRADTIAEMKSSWSEEDETGWTNTIIMLKEGASHHFTNFSIVPCVDWLKSLKDRYTWKPSSEQIDALEHFVRSIGESDYASPYENNTKLLYLLLNDLKKLTE